MECRIAVGSPQSEMVEYCPFRGWDRRDEIPYFRGRNGDIINGVNGCLVGDYDPQFTDAANGDYTLEKKSPCRDAGALLSWMTPSALDLAGKARVFGNAPDIGCYEWWQKLIGLSIFVR